MTKVGSKTSYLTNLFFGKSCSPYLFSPQSCSINSGIIQVVFVRIPSKVFNLVIGTVSIIVASLHSLGTGTNKGFQYQSVDRTEMFLGPVIWIKQRNQEIFSVFSLFSFYPGISSMGEYPSFVCNCISRIVRDVSDFFINQMWKPGEMLVCFHGFNITWAE